MRDSERIRIRATQDHSVELCGIRLPQGTVYGIFPPVRGMVKLYAWIKNPRIALTNQRFCVYTIRMGDNTPKEEYVDAGKCGYARALKSYLVNHADSMVEFCPSVGSLRDISVLSPHDKKIGIFIQRPRPGKEDSPYTNTRITTEVSVTAGCKVGKNFYTEEGYISERMGIHADNYGEIGKDNLDMMRELAKLSSKCRDELPDVFGE